MTDYLLDTNHISPIVTIEHPLRQKLLAQRQANHTFAIAAPVLSEFIYGISLLPRAERNLAEWARLKQDFIYYSISPQDAEQSAKLRVSLRQQGWQLGIIDAMIAVIAVRNDLVLLTSDKDFRSVPGLKRENWRS